MPWLGGLPHRHDWPCRDDIPQTRRSRRGGDIKLLHLPARIHNLLVVTRLITLFDVFESEEKAVRSFSVAAGVQEATL